MAASDDFVGLAELDDRVLFVNPAGRAMLGLSPDADLQQHTMTDFIAPEQRDLYRAKALPALLARGEWVGETWLRHGDGGESVPVQHRVFTIAPSGQRKHALVATISRDLRERRSLTRALAQAQEALARSAQTAEMGELAASIAHEITQPLAAIATNAQACLHWLAHEPPDLPEARTAARSIAADGLRGGQIIERMRSLVRQSMPHSDEVDLNEMVRQTLQIAHQSLPDTGFALGLELQPGLPTVRGDALQLQQVLLNLLHNASDAVQAAVDGEHRLSIVTRRDLTGDLVVDVRDTGHGMAPAVMARLFEPYQSGKRDGMGLGLAISRRIVEAHGGRLWVARSDERGTVVSFSLPAGGTVA